MRDRIAETAPTKKAEVTVREKEPAPAKETPSPFAQFQQAGNAALVAMLAESGIQPKLQVGAVYDPAEAEADRMADDVLRSLKGPKTGDAGDPPVARVSRKLRRVAASDAPGHGLDGGAADPGVERGIERARGGGQPLDPAMRSDMEHGFGADFSGIRVHTDSTAATLSRSLNAQAFTTGSDIFFSGGQIDRRVMAHELAHTVQQGAAPVRRFVAPTEFAKMTDQGTFTMKGTAQKKIEKYLAEYFALTGKKADAAVYKNPIIPPDKLQAAINLLELMHLTADGWLNAHSKKDEQGVRGEVEMNRAKRGAGMVTFDAAVKDEKSRLAAQLAEKADTAQDKKAIAATNFDNRADKIKKKFTGSLTDGFSLAATAVGALITHDGESTDFVLDITIPVGGPGYVSITLDFNLRKEGNIELGLDLKVGAGAKVPQVADVRGALGGFVKASGKTARAAVDLAKYGIYRRLRESKAVPRELANKIWGGDSGAAGYEQAEKWGKQIEEKHLSEKGSYVETGGLVEGKAKLGGDLGGGGITAQYQSGTRHDKESIEAAKGKLGADNTRASDGEKAVGDKRGAQAKTGRAVENIHLAGEISAGPFKGQLIFDWSYRYDGDTKKTEFSAIEMQMNARVSLPIKDLASVIVSMVGSLGATVKGKAVTYSKQAEEAAQRKMAGLSPKKTTGLEDLKTVMGFVTPTLLTGNNIANAVAFDKAGVPWTQWASGVTKEGASASATGPKLLSKVGLEVGLRLRGDVATGETGLLELRHVSELDAALPELLKVQLTRKTRLGAAKWNGTGWVAST